MTARYPIAGIVRFDDSGAASMRVWGVTDSSAERLSDLLGHPHAEMLVDPSAFVAVTSVVEASDEVVILDHSAEGEAA